MPTLTDRQMEIAQLTALGLTQKEIAAHLGLEYSTIRNHRQRIYRILGVHNMIEMLHALTDTQLVRKMAPPFQADVLRGERSAFDGKLVGDNGIDPEEDDDEE